MILVIGLGNPGRKYARTRHNVGWLVLEALAKKAKSEKRKAKSYNLKFKTKKKLKAEICEAKIEGQPIVLAKPLTFMNNSGEAVKQLIFNFQFSIFNLYVVHDDLDIPLGSFKIQLGKGPREHKGIKSIEEALGTKGFWRVRVGVENRKLKVKSEKLKVSGEEYVLGEFTGEEMKVLGKTMPLITKSLLEKIKGVVTIFWGS